MPQPDSSTWFFDVEGIPNAPAESEATRVDYNPDFYEFSPTYDPITNPDTFMTFAIRPNWTMEFDLMTTDSTFDTLYQYVEGVGFDYQLAGVEFFNADESDTLRGKDTLMSTFRWTPDCQFFAQGGGQINIVTIDKFCKEQVNIRPIYFEIIEDNSPPTIIGTVGLNEDATEELVSPKDQQFRKRVGERLVFDFETRDPDRDKVHVFYEWDSLDSRDTRFFLLDMGISVGRNQNSHGDTLLTSTFSWYNREIDCDVYEVFNENNPLELRVIAVDSSCLNATDTSIMLIDIHDGVNPVLTVRDVDGEIIERNGNSVSLSFREEDLGFTVYGLDRDSTLVEEEDFLVDQVLMSVDPDGFTFDEKGMILDEKIPGRYVDQLDSIPFYWNPACEDRNSDPLTMYFKVVDNSCGTLLDSIALEVEPVTDLVFPNIITVNGDNINDKLSIDSESQRCGFEAVRVYSRWGKLVFESEESDFSFEAANLPAGDYFYEMRFENRSISQTLKVMK